MGRITEYIHFINSKDYTFEQLIKYHYINPENYKKARKEYKKMLRKANNLSSK